MSIDNNFRFGHGLFRQDQVDQLLKPINPVRVMQRQQSGRTFSYITAADARAHMNRIFGFGNWDSRTLHVEILTTDEVTASSGKSAWQVSALSTVEVSVRNPRGEHVCTYSESAVATSKQPSKGDALDMSVKSATSDAFKRCLVDLGEQYALGLYYDIPVGTPVVKATMVQGYPDEPEGEPQAAPGDETDGHDN